MRTSKEEGRQPPLTEDERGVSRRAYLAAAGGVVAVAVVGGAAYYLSQPTPTPTPTATPTPTPTATPTPTPTATPTPTPTAKAVTIAFGDDIDEFDPTIECSEMAEAMFLAMYDRLIDPAVIGGPKPYFNLGTYEKFVPLVAESWNWSEDKSKVIFNIRKGIKCHDGSELTAEDLKYALQRNIKVEVGDASFILGTMCGVDPDKIEAPDDYKLIVPVNPPGNPLIFPALTLRACVVYKGREAMKHATPDDPAATKWMHTNYEGLGMGPFKLAKREEGVQAIFEAFPDYFRGKPKIDKLIFKMIPEASQRVMLVTKGVVDIAWEVSPKDARLAIDDPNVNLVVAPSTRFTYIAFNERIKPFDNVKVRQALSYAFPYDEVIKQVWYGLAERCLSPIPKAVPSYKPVIKYEYNLDMAKKLLEEAGLPDGFTTQLYYRLGIDYQKDTAIWFQSECKKIGVEIELIGEPEASIKEKWIAGTLPVFIRDVAPWIPDPGYLVAFQYTTKGSFNQRSIFYSNEEVDKLHEENMYEPDMQKRNAAYGRIQEIIAEEAPMIWCYLNSWIMPMHKRLKGYVYYADEQLRSFDLDIE
jgi:peptide/nickel transport system substrate-binding protein